MTSQLNKHHALVSWSLVAFLLLCAALPIATILQEQSESYRFELAKDGRTLQYLQSISASRSQLEAANSEFQNRNLSEWVFPAGESPESVSLAIQRTVSDALTTAKANIQTISPSQTLPSEGVMSVGVRAQFTGSLDVIQQVLQELESSRPLLTVEDLRLVATVSRVASKGAPPQVLQVSFSVVTYLPTATEGAGS